MNKNIPVGMGALYISRQANVVQTGDNNAIIFQTHLLFADFAVTGDGCLYDTGAQ
jgi:hypothetical protein